MQVVNLAVKGMCREYIEMYGVDTLVPERKLPFTDRILASIFRAPEGAISKCGICMLAPARLRSTAASESLTHEYKSWLAGVNQLIVMSRVVSYNS